MKKIKEYLLKDRTPFAEGLSFKKMFLIFVIFSFLGCLYEDVLFMAKNYINYGILDYSTKRGGAIIFRIISNIWLGSMYHGIYSC